MSIKHEVNEVMEAQKEAQQAFESALKRGHLSNDPMSELHIDNYMYMYNDGDFYKFKHIDTREYYSVPVLTA